MLIIGPVYRKAAVVCLAALIYSVLATELAEILKPKAEEKPEKALKRKRLPTVSCPSDTRVLSIPFI